MIAYHPEGSPFAHLFKKTETVVLGYQGINLSCSFMRQKFSYFVFQVDWDDEEDNEDAKKSSTKMNLGGHRG